jgi:starch synthase
MQYGTLPIVSNVGGLADTVININKKHSNLKKATGFVMQQTSSEALYDEIIRAINVFQNPEKWELMIKNGMKRNSSWKRSANEYQKLYKLAILGNNGDNKKDNKIDSQPDPEQSGSTLSSPTQPVLPTSAK